MKHLIDPKLFNDRLRKYNDENLTVIFDKEINYTDKIPSKVYDLSVNKDGSVYGFKKRGTDYFYVLGKDDGIKCTFVTYNSDYYGATRTISMFSKLILKTIAFKNIDFSELKSAKCMFEFLKANLLDLSSCNFNSLEDASFMFFDAEIQNLNLEGLDFSGLKDASSMFDSLKADLLDLCGCNFNSLKDANFMFWDAEIQNLNLEGVNFSQVKSDFSQKKSARDLFSENTRNTMFSNLKTASLNLSGCNFENLEDVNITFVEKKKRYFTKATVRLVASYIEQGKFNESELTGKEFVYEIVVAPIVETVNITVSSKEEADKFYENLVTRNHALYLVANDGYKRKVKKAKEG